MSDAPPTLPALGALQYALASAYQRVLEEDPEEVVALRTAVERYATSRRWSRLLPLLGPLEFPVPPGVTDSETAALELHDLLASLPEYATSRADATPMEGLPAEVCAVEDEHALDPAPGAHPDYPLLRAHGREGRTLWLVGGRQDNTRLDALRTVIPELTWEWAAITERSTDVTRTLTQIRNGSAVAVIVFTGASGHVASGSVLRAGRERGVPVVLTRLPGTRRLAAALAEIESRLAP